jgi:ABC-2 type transport system permease protein
MRVMALVKRICLERVRDKRTLALLFVAPLLILTLMYFFFNGDAVEPKLGVVNVDKNLMEILEDADINTKQVQRASENVVVDEGLDGVLEQNDGKYELILENRDPSSAKSLRMKVNQAIAAQAQMNMMEKQGASLDLSSNVVDTDYVYGNGDTVFFDVLGPIFIGFFVFFFVFLISGIGLLKERTTGTLERLMSTPIRRREIVTAYLIGYGLFAVIQTLIVVFYATTVLDIVLVGSLWHVILINLLVALVALSLGILLSTFAASEFQMVQFIPVVVIPQIFFVGIIPLEGMADWLQVLGKVMPLYYAADALKAVMYQGLALGDITKDLLALVIFALLFIVLNLVALKKYRTL